MYYYCTGRHPHSRSRVFMARVWTRGCPQMHSEAALDSQVAHKRKVTTTASSGGGLYRQRWKGPGNLRGADHGVGTGTAHLLSTFVLIRLDSAPFCLRQVKDETSGKVHTFGGATTAVIQISEQSQSFRFLGLKSSGRPVPSILRGFSAPIILELNNTEVWSGPMGEMAATPACISQCISFLVDRCTTGGLELSAQARL